MRRLICPSEPEALYPRRAFLRRLSVVAAAAGALRGRVALGQAAADPLTVSQTEEAISLKLRGKEFARYQLRVPAAGPSAGTPSAGFFHPIATPQGTVVTALGQGDQQHLRGFFMAWNGVEGTRKGEFWGGLGRAASATAGRIVNQSASVRPPILGATNAQVVNEWRVADQTLVVEEVRFTVFIFRTATVIDWAVRLTPKSPTRLAQKTVGGMTLQARGDAAWTAIGPDGPVSRPPSKDTEVRSLWPDAAWYGLHGKTKDGKEATVVVVGRAKNPETAWYVIPAKGLINPTMTAHRALTLAKDQPLSLRYRLIAADGPPDTAMLRELGEGYYRAGS